MAFREFVTPQMSRRGLLRSGAWLGAGAALGGLPFGATAVHAADSARWPSVARLVNDYVSARKVATIVAALGWGQRPPEVIAAGTLALGQAAPAGADSLFRVYSMTKPITGMAAMMLIEDGRLGLNQPIADFLPAFANMMVQKTYDGSLADLEPAKTPITVRHLLTHTAGLGYGIIQKGPIRQAYMDAGLSAGQASKLKLPQFSGAPSASSLADFADRLAKLPLVYQPGTHWSYSVSLDLLGRVIEVASDTPFDVFLKTRLFEPAGMTSSFFEVPASETGRLTTNYFRVGETLMPIDPGNNSIFAEEPPFPMGGSGLVMSANDYDRFLRMLVGYGSIDGTRVMSEPAVRVGTSNLLPEGVKTAGTFADGSGFGAGGRVGLGAQAGTFGWGGAAGTAAFVDLHRGLRATLMTQYMPSDAYGMTAEFTRAVLSDLAAMPGRAAA
ncbi:beta-lactamase family protein [Tsuneonella sp. YG55]|uniref:Beta-lactamase family protein n=1 Tax=Tsuneonella litorea TaxID=2976475 RepID=A0A9X2VZK6_9SPHN|nr:serine hydrolase domain-containing protein [Tsuneonella litorea]MCT2558320.1 beta-lactamase family protein [Tsuneonella litorea]